MTPDELADARRKTILRKTEHDNCLLKCRTDALHRFFIRELSSGGPFTIESPGYKNAWGLHRPCDNAELLDSVISKFGDDGWVVTVNRRWFGGVKSLTFAPSPEYRNPLKRHDCRKIEG